MFPWFCVPKFVLAYSSTPRTECSGCGTKCENLGRGADPMKTAVPEQEGVSGGTGSRVGYAGQRDESPSSHSLSTGPRGDSLVTG